MPTATASLDSLLAAAQHAFERSNRLLADAAGAAPGVALHGLSLRIRCYAVDAPGKPQGGAPGLALSLSPPGLWQRLFRPAAACDLLVAVTAGQAALQFLPLPAGGAPARSAAGGEGWIFLLSEEQTARIRELALAPRPTPGSRLRSRWREFIGRG